MFKSGFVNIVGLPNVGKSSMVNSIMGEKMSIVSHKPQTTRQRIFSILNGDNHQIIFSDSPGWIENANYTLHKLMNEQVENQRQDADVFLIVADAKSEQLIPQTLADYINLSKKPIFLVLNKMDLAEEGKTESFIDAFQAQFPASKMFLISAKKNIGVQDIVKAILGVLPEHPPYFDTDYSSDKPVRFFISELIREHIYKLYQDEIPYSCYIQIDSVNGIDDQLPLVKINATIFVNKKSQLPIVIGKNGSMIKELGIQSRLSIEQYLNQKVFLGLSVKVNEDWRNNENLILIHSCCI